MKNNLIKIIAVLAFIFLTCSINVFGQATKLKATSVCTKTVSEGKWGEWSSPQKSGILIILDLNNDKITLDNGQDKNIFEIVNKDKPTKKDGTSEFAFDCINNGVNTKVILLLQWEMAQVYILFDGAQIMYNVVVLVKE